MKLIIGLGNPGSTYEKTRHNIGIIIIDYLVTKFSIIKRNKFHQGELWIANYEEEQVFFVKPFTFMNNSSECVIAFQKKYKINCNDILIIHDDKDFEFTKYKYQQFGGHAGHNGVKDIIEKNMCGNKFNRLRVGIKNSRINSIGTKNFVLQNFSKNEEEILKKEIFEKILESIKTFIKNDISTTMNKWNKKENIS